MEISCRDFLNALIKNSLGIKLFRNAYFKKNKKVEDICKNGKLSCAFYVSTLLKIVNLVENIHYTVKGTLKDMERSGWRESKILIAPCVVVWSKLNNHYHLGFYVGDNKFVSNNSSKGIIKVHPNFKNRKIVKIYCHKNLCYN